MNDMHFLVQCAIDSALYPIHGVCFVVVVFMHSCLSLIHSLHRLLLFSHSIICFIFLHLEHCLF